jgi:ribosomal protein S18 acetylase RimI-like enzyme
MPILTNSFIKRSNVVLKENKIKFSIQEVLIKDINEISFIHILTWKESYKNIIDDEYLKGLNLHNKIDSWKKILDNKENFNILAINNKSEIVGFFSGGPEREDSVKCGEVYAIYVLEKYQGLGIGYNLWKNSCLFLKNKGYSRSKLWVLENNKKAIDFYCRNYCVFTNKKKKIYL